MVKLLLRMGLACVLSGVLAVLVLMLSQGASVRPVQPVGTPFVPAVTVFSPTPTPAVVANATIAPQAARSTPTSPAVRATSQPPAAQAATAQPQAAPTAVPTPLSTASPAPISLPASAKLSGLRYERQGFNNCGPATVSMMVNHFGIRVDQNVAMAMLRPVNGVTGDRSVGPLEMAAFAESQGLKARVILGASVEQLKALIVAGIAPIAETWYIPDPNDEMGHYQLLIGFDGDNLQFYDSYKGPNVVLRAADFDALWRAFNRTTIVAWRPEQETTVRQIFGDLMDDRLMAERALATAQSEAQRNPQDKWAQFNIGSSLLRLGDSAGAAKAYDAARKIGLPWRMLWYQYGPYNAYYDVGRYDEVIALANETLRPVNNLEESYYWRAQAYAAKGQNDAAQRDLATVQRLKPNFNAKLQAYP